MLSYSHSIFDDRIYWKEAISLQNAGFTIVHIAVGDRNCEYISEEGIKCVEVKKNSRTNLLKIPYHLQAVLRAAEKEKAVAYHLHDWQLNYLVRRIKQFHWKPLLVYDAHEHTSSLLRQESYDSKHNILQRLKRILFSLLAGYWEKYYSKKCDAIISAEPFTLVKLTGNKKYTLNNVIRNYSFFHPTNFCNTAEKEYDVIYSGSLTVSRGITEIIYAVEILKHEIPNIRILLIGTFADREFEIYCTQLIKELNISNNIEIHPQVPFSRMEDFYSKSRTGICTLHLTEKFRDAIAIKIFEYMAFGLPVVVSKDCVNADYINEAGAGISVSPTDSNEIANAVKVILQNPQLYKTFSDNGKKAIQEKYNWENEAIKLISLYNSLFNAG